MINDLICGLRFVKTHILINGGKHFVDTLKYVASHYTTARRTAKMNRTGFIIRI